jgi:DNA-binding response OmpR family regulator
MTEIFVALVADDEEDILELVAFRMRKAGYRVITATNGIEAYKLAVRNLPDIILLDIRMPGMTGLEVTRALRVCESTKNIPVILLTASVRDDAVAGGFEAGADDYIKKPFSPSEVVARAQALLDKR